MAERPYLSSVNLHAKASVMIDRLRARADRRELTTLESDLAGEWAFTVDALVARLRAAEGRLSKAEAYLCGFSRSDHPYGEVARELLALIRAEVSDG